MKIILASASPRRQELLRLIAPSFMTVPADIDETLPSSVPIEYAAEFLAVKKARRISVEYPNEMIIGCDTVVIEGKKILGKPKDETDALRMLSLLSGKTHDVITGVSICFDKKEYSFSELTRVEFYPLSIEEISDYIKTGEPFDKAGAYGIQGKGCVLVKGINGDFFNVVGLPVARLRREINRICPSCLLR